MYASRIIRHSEINPEQLNEIIRLKQIAWPYRVEQQLDWITKNLSSEDLHLILDQDGKPVAYLNLVQVQMEINGTNNRGYGIGNVCSALKGKGYGQALMKQVNLFLRKEGKTGLLFCRDSLIGFYSLCDWNLLDKAILQLNFDNTAIDTMIYNCQEKIAYLKYSDKSF